MLLQVSPSVVLVNRQGIPEEARPIADPHVTLLRGVSMAPLLGTLGPQAAEVLAALPPLPDPRLGTRLHLATRPPHPTKDPPGTTHPLRTWFRTVENQAAFHDALEQVVLVLAQLAARPFPHPERHRFFHLSCFNNRGGDGMRSIGDICAEDALPMGLQSAE